METFAQPKITGYRQLSEAEVELMNEGKALAEQCRTYVDKLRQYPPTKVDGIPRMHEGSRGPDGALPSLDMRWISIGATDLQRGFMAIIRGIAQPTTF